MKLDLTRLNCDCLNYEDVPIIAMYTYQATEDEIKELRENYLDEPLSEYIELSNEIDIELTIYSEYDFKVEFCLDNVNEAGHHYGVLQEISHDQGELLSIIPYGFIVDLWNAFGDVPIDNNDLIDEKWLYFEKGTNRFEVWEWFERMFKVSVKELMEG